MGDFGPIGLPLTSFDPNYNPKLEEAGRPAPDGSPDSLEHYQSQYVQSKNDYVFEPPYFFPMPFFVPAPPTPKQPEPAPPNGDGHGPPRAPGARAASAPPILHDKKLLCQVCQKVALGIRWLTCKGCKQSDLKPPNLEQLCSGHRRSNAFVGCEYARRSECNNGRCQSCHCQTEQTAVGKPLSQRRHQRKASRRQADDRRLEFPKTEMEGRNLGRRATLNAPPTSSEMRILGLPNINA
ncbi:unnamed protein product [Symbiodinium sp. CCMP2456]|nr:unnamed protein product [Symbiodinium sp. CCMP2456]